ncbi:MAG: hypothetical protein HZA20_04215 [Nitrospirae bacterium]|nr:hypothetical protein [Nitrospirota bacterium]
MIRKIALEMALMGLLAYSLVTLHGVMTQYDPLAEFGAEGGEAVRGAAALPDVKYVATDGADILERSLFNPDRGAGRKTQAAMKTGAAAAAPEAPPQPVQPPAPPPPPPVMPSISLKGILENTVGEQVAVIEVEGQRARSYRVGDMFGDFELIEIGRLDVKLRWNNEPVELHLRGATTEKDQAKRGQPKPK